MLRFVSCSNVLNSYKVVLFLLLVESDYIVSEHSNDERIRR